MLMGWTLALSFRDQRSVQPRRMYVTTRRSMGDGDVVEEQTWREDSGDEPAGYTYVDWSIYGDFRKFLG